MVKIIEKKMIVKNKQGLHARPAAFFVQLANKFDSTISIIKDEQKINGKSIMGVLMLAAEQEILVIAEGEDAQEAIDALEEFVSRDE